MNISLEPLTLEQAIQNGWHLYRYPPQILKLYKQISSIQKKSLSNCSNIIRAPLGIIILPRNEMTEFSSQIVNNLSFFFGNIRVSDCS